MSTPDPWITKWLDAVTGTSMTQRRMSSIEKHGGVGAVEKAARERGIHLVQVTDDHGDVLVAASRQPFKVIC